MHILELSLAEGVPLAEPGKVLYLPVPKEPYILRLAIGATSLVSQNGVVHTNYPPKGTKFERKKFYDYKLRSHSLHEDHSVEIIIHTSGTFCVYTTYAAANGNYGSIELDRARTPDWYFVVNSNLVLGERSIDANSLCVQTLLPKCMGPRSSWPEKLARVAEKGYNMVHLVPLQERGESGSPFSIRDQLKWDPEVFKDTADVENLIKELHSAGLLALSDVVLNHTANDTAWLKDHPDAGYSAQTAPHLEPAIELDLGLRAYSQRLEKDKVEISNEADCARIIATLDDEVFRAIKLWEYYVLDVEGLSKEAERSQRPQSVSHGVPNNLDVLAQLLLQNAGNKVTSMGKRFHRTVDAGLLANLAGASQFSPKDILDKANVSLYAEYDADRECIKTQLFGRLKFLRLDAHGPRLGTKVTKTAPIAEPYFTLVKTKNGTVELANNGWVWAGDPTTDFAGPTSRAYLRREMVIWGDCVKLRFGDKPEDSPFLWQHMGKYVRLLSRLFDGLRIDNCHSTPLHVGEYLLDHARAVKPDLYVVAELFSGSQDLDKKYVEHLGISSLLREALMPGSVRDLSTLVNVHGGLAIGSFVGTGVAAGEISGENVEILRPQPIHAWLMECTHDNEMPAEKRTVEDTLSTAGLVAFCQVASGSTMGTDECYPHALDIVSEDREYVMGGGISEAKRTLNSIHYELGQKDAFESFTHLDGQYITVHRLNPETGEGYFLIARTKFHEDGPQKLPDTFLEHTKVEWKAGWRIACHSEPSNPKDKIVPLEVEVTDLEPFGVEFDGSSSTIKSPEPHQFPQGSIAIFATSRTFDAPKVENLIRVGHNEAVAKLDLLDLNVLLYRCDAEEQDETQGRLGSYDVPEYGKLIYAGLQGWRTPLNRIVHDNDLGHAVCKNLRDGLWALHSLVERLRFYRDQRGYSRLDPVIKWLEERVQVVETVPSSLRPRYFAALIMGLHTAAVNRALDQMPDHFGQTKFVNGLALTSVQMVTKLPNASLSALEDVPSMAAGLPHFSSGIMRCWGRDVFLSTRGLLLETGRLERAKEHIIHFGATLKHGLIPNLLDSGRNPRYNARDAVWFFVQFVQEYCRETKSYDILDAKVKRRFPKDDTFVEWDSPEAYSYESTVGELVYEVLARHAGGITFREHNAGDNIDRNMKDNGFNQHIEVDWENGLIFGGNQDNCGTWMDKMGESHVAHNHGVPGTPRDGAAVEISGLLKSCLRWVVETTRSGKYKFPSSVKKQDGHEISLSDWNNLLQVSFERCYYVPLDASKDGNYDVDPKILHRRGIYKDLYRSGKPYEDYQLRPNFAIAMVVAPELFEHAKAVSALGVADEALRGPVGMATLDPDDFNYRPYYENGIENDDFHTSKGRNYHQGPEWVWCEGVFLQALVLFDRLRGRPIQETQAMLRARIQHHAVWLASSPWAGLTELTQRNGELCGDSSPTQAWSGARLLEVFAEMASAEEA